MGCFREDGLGREGGLMKMISFMKVVWSFLRWSDEVGHEAHGGGEGWGVGVSHRSASGVVKRSLEGVFLCVLVFSYQSLLHALFRCLQR